MSRHSSTEMTARLSCWRHTGTFSARPLLLRPLSEDTRDRQDGQRRDDPPEKCVVAFAQRHPDTEAGLQAGTPVSGRRAE